MSVQIGANRKIDSYLIHIYKLLEMDNVVELDIGQNAHDEGDWMVAVFIILLFSKLRIIEIGSYSRNVKSKPWVGHLSNLLTNKDNNIIQLIVGGLFLGRDMNEAAQNFEGVGKNAGLVPQKT